MIDCWPFERWVEAEVSDAKSGAREELAELTERLDEIGTAAEFIVEESGRGDNNGLLEVEDNLGDIAATDWIFS